MWAKARRRRTDTQVSRAHRHGHCHRFVAAAIVAAVWTAEDNASPLYDHVRRSVRAHAEHGANAPRRLAFRDDPACVNPEEMMLEVM